MSTHRTSPRTHVSIIKYRHFFQQPECCSEPREAKARLETFLFFLFPKEVCSHLCKWVSKKMMEKIRILVRNEQESHLVAVSRLLRRSGFPSLALKSNEIVISIYSMSAIKREDSLASLHGLVSLAA